MSPKKRAQKLLGYVRVSRMKEDGISPDLQKQAITAYATAHGHEVTWLDPDLDQSGKSLKRPVMQQALASLARGEADGIIAARLDRFTRKVSDLGTLLQLAEEGDWNLVAIDLGVDLTTANGRVVANVLASIAEWELDRRRESWKEARHNAVVDRGVYISASPPAGYGRGEDKKLFPNEWAPQVLRAFEARAKGAPWSEVCRVLEGVPTSRGATAWTKAAAKKMLSNPAYIGTARHGQDVNTEAHEAIVSKDLFTRVQRRHGVTGPQKPRSGAPLSGIIRCAGCGEAMTKDWTIRSGIKYNFYRCKNSATCKARASIGCERVELFALKYVMLNATFPPEEPSRAPGEALAAAEVRLDAAMVALEDWALAWQAEGVSPAMAASMAAGLEAERDAALEGLNSLPVAPGNVLEGYAPELWKRMQAGPFQVPELAPYAPVWEPEERKEVLRMTVERINVKQGRAPVAERVEITLNPEVVAA